MCDPGPCRYPPASGADPFVPGRDDPHLCFPCCSQLQPLKERASSPLNQLLCWPPSLNSPCQPCAHVIALEWLPVSHCLISLTHVSHCTWHKQGVIGVKHIPLGQALQIGHERFLSMHGTMQGKMHGIRISAPCSKLI